MEYVKSYWKGSESYFFSRSATQNWWSIYLKTSPSKKVPSFVFFAVCICLFVYLSICLAICLFDSLYVCLSPCWSACLCVFLSVCVSLSVILFLSACFSVCFCIRLSVYLSVIHSVSKSAKDLVNQSASQPVSLL